MGDGSVWVHGGFDGDLFRVDADTLRVIDVLHLGVGSSSDVGSGMAVAGGAVWITVAVAVARIEFATSAHARTIA